VRQLLEEGEVPQAGGGWGWEEPKGSIQTLLSANTQKRHHKKTDVLTFLFKIFEN
jgi:hypothetical protein